MNRREYLAGVTGVGLAGVTGCVDALAEDDYDIGMDPEAFVPEEYTVTAGTTVVWHNTSSRGHTVTGIEGSIPDAADYFASGGFDDEETAREAWNTSGETGMLYSGDTFEHTFEVPGTYEYVCLPHVRADMVGTIVVE